MTDQINMREISQMHWQHDSTQYSMLNSWPCNMQILYFWYTTNEILPIFSLNFPVNFHIHILHIKYYMAHGQRHFPCLPCSADSLHGNFFTSLFGAVRQSKLNNVHYKHGQDPNLCLYSKLLCHITSICTLTIYLYSFLYSVCFDIL